VSHADLIHCRQHGDLLSLGVLQHGRLKVRTADAAAEAKHREKVAKVQAYCAAIKQMLKMVCLCPREESDVDRIEERNVVASAADCVDHIASVSRCRKALG
jgi:hypothetical protein